jgi:hypothetical protein
MIIAFSAIMLICLIVVVRTDDRTMRYAFIGFFLLNLLAAIVAIREGNAFKFMPYDRDDEPSYYRD